MKFERNKYIFLIAAPEKQKLTDRRHLINFNETEPKNNWTVRMDGQISGSNSSETIKMGGGRDHSFLFSFYKTLDIERITFLI